MSKKEINDGIENCGSFIAIINKKMACKLPVSEILYIEHRNRKTTFFSETEEYYMYCKIDSVYNLLDENFYRFSKTLILNLYKIKKVEDAEVVFLDGRRIFVSRKGYAALKQRYAQEMIIQGLAGKIEKYKQIPK